MSISVLKTTLSGMMGGLVLGKLVGGYVAVQTHEAVVERDAYKTPLLREQAESSYTKTTVTAFAITFAFVGAFVSHATFPAWLRPAVYGIVYSFVTVIAITVVGAAITGQQPVNMHKGSSRAIIDFARSYGVLASLILGPIAGIVHYQRGQSSRRRSGCA